MAGLAPTASKPLDTTVPPKLESIPYELQRYIFNFIFAPEDLYRSCLICKALYPAAKDALDGISVVFRFYYKAPNDLVSRAMNAKMESIAGEGNVFFGEGLFAWVYTTASAARQIIEDPDIRPFLKTTAMARLRPIEPR